MERSEAAETTGGGARLVEAPPVGIGKREDFSRNPWVAGGLALLVGVAVFYFLLRIRKTFGMKE